MSVTPKIGLSGQCVEVDIHAGVTTFKVSGARIETIEASGKVRYSTCDTTALHTAVDFYDVGAANTPTSPDGVKYFQAIDATT